MDRKKAMPVLASAAIALSLSACGMMGKDQGGAQTSSAQTSSRQQSSGQSASASGSQGGASMSELREQQAAAPDLVRDVQRTLGAKGYDPGSVDGVYGSGTESALRSFQRDQKLNATGQIDAPTLSALGVTGDPQGGQRAATGQQPPKRQGASAPPPPSQPQQASQQPPRGQSAAANLSRQQISSIQQNLNERGYDAGNADGTWGPQTQAALRNFERDQSLQADGRPDPQTLAALGVESGSPSTQTGEMRDPRGAMPPQRGPQPQRNPPPPSGSQAPGEAPERSDAPDIWPEEGEVPR